MRLAAFTPRRVLHALQVLVVLPAASVLRARKPNIWLVTERSDQARDNGYCFYKYLRMEHPEQPVYYVIDRNASDRQKLLGYGEDHIIAFNTCKHYLYYCASKTHISAHTGGCAPSDNPFTRFLKPVLKHRNVFVPHGVSYGISEFCLAKYGHIDLFICSGRPEYKNVLANYGYKPDQVAYTGFPRLDGWHDITVNPKQIVLMPTWRMYLAQNPDTVIEETSYFRAYQSLLTSTELAEFLVPNELKLVFYLHHEMRKYVGSFTAGCPNIEVVYKDETYDIQELLKDSALLITDYSSVHFDFAYMGKPVLYYQFDREEFWDKQYVQSDFDAAKDGFGPVAYDLDQLLDNLKESYAQGFRLQGEYERRMHEFYPLHDKHNCERVYAAIKECGW